MTDSIRFMQGWRYRAAMMNIANRYGQTDRVYHLVMEGPNGEIEETSTWADLP